MPSKHSSAAPTWTFTTPNRRRVRTPVGGPSLTKQEFLETCDINHIMAKYQHTGAIDHYAKYAPEYRDTTPCDYQESLNLVKRAQKLFDDLPANIKRETQTPEGFLAFVQNPANKQRMQELGLVQADTPTTDAATLSQGA